MLFFVRNAVAFQILALAAVFSWVHGGTRPDLLLPVVPWLTFFIWQMGLVFPQAKSTENLAQARSRVLHSLVRDPAAWLALLSTIYLAIPLFNATGAPVYDAVAKEWILPKVPIPWLPSCVDSSEQASMLLWFPPVFSAAIIARHALLKRGKRIVMQGVCWNAAALAALGLIQLWKGAKGIFWVGEEMPRHFFSTFGYPNFAGAFFTFAFLLSLGLWIGRINSFVACFGPDALRKREVDSESETAFAKYGLLIPVFLNLAGAICSLSRAAILLTAVSLLAYGVYVLSGFIRRASSSQRLISVSVAAAVLVTAVLGSTLMAPRAYKDEIKTITFESVWKRISGQECRYHNRVAMQIFSDYPAYGSGAWGYPHYQKIYMSEKEIKSMQIIGGANVHNDYCQFLAEFGTLGFCLIVSTMLCFVSGAVVRLVRYNRSASSKRIALSPKWLYRMPPEAVAVFVASTATLIHALGDLPFRTPAVVIMWLCAWACLDGFVPSTNRK